MHRPKPLNINQEAPATPFEKVLVGLDFSSADEQVLKFTHNFRRLCQPKEMVMVNVHKEMEIPEDVQTQFPELGKDIDKIFVERMAKEAREFKVAGTMVHYQVLKGAILDEIVRNSSKKSIDLVIVGRKKDKDHRGMVHHKLVRKVKSSVLIVPQKAPEAISNILVAIDYSDYSRHVLEKAINLAKSSGGKLYCQNVYEVPSGYSKTGKSYSEFASIMKENAENHFHKFIADIDTKGVEIEPVFSLCHHDEYAEAIRQGAEDTDASLVIIGARGKSGISLFLLGSVAETVVELVNDRPILVVKDKEKEFGAWELLQKI